jgi:hypothetical protein
MASVRPEARPRNAIVNMFTDYVLSDPYLKGVYMNANEATRQQMFSDFKRGARF